MIVLGVSGGLSHDPAAAIVVDGKLIAAAEEERFIRKKQARFEPPINAMVFCLDAAGIELSDVDFIATGWDPGLSPDAEFPKAFLASILNHEIFLGKKLPPIYPVDHHIAHAYASWAGSGFSEGGVLVADGKGERVSTTLYKGRGRSLEKLIDFEIKDSLGYLYGATTRHLGFSRGSEGKMMGLAAYGKPDFDFPVVLTDEGYFVDLEVERASWDPYGRNLMRSWDRWLTSNIGARPARNIRYDAPAGKAKWSIDDVMSNANIAASAQATLERVMIHLARIALAEAGSRNLVLGGGVALNCSCNGKIANLPEVENLYVFPAAGDGGTAVGAAFWAANEMGDPEPGRIRHAYYGPSYDDDQIGAAIAAAGVEARRIDSAPEAAAELVLEGAVVGWFQGASEIGPRALGHRSIIADPRQPGMLEKVNIIKGRELWRPLAPSALPETVSRMLGHDKASPFMLRAFEVLPEIRDELPAVVHVDGTTRAQIVDKETNAEYANLLSSVGASTGNSVVLNTSFNDESEPIVQTPGNALRTFFSTGLDALVIGNWLLQKRR